MSTAEEENVDDEVTRIIDQDEESPPQLSENGVDNPELDEEGKSAMALLGVEDTQDGHSQESRSSCISPASSHGGQYSVRLYIQGNEAKFRFIWTLIYFYIQIINFFVKFKIDYHLFFRLNY